MTSVSTMGMWEINNFSALLCGKYIATCYTFLYIVIWPCKQGPYLPTILNSLPNHKILVVTKLEAFADNKLNVAKVTISLFDSVENAFGKGENAGYQHFLLFPQCFPKPSSLRSLKVGIVR